MKTNNKIIRDRVSTESTLASGSKQHQLYQQHSNLKIKQNFIHHCYTKKTKKSYPLLHTINNFIQQLFEENEIE